MKETADTVDSIMLSTNKRQVGELLSGLIQTKYPNGASVVDFDELLQWDLWPSFIKFYGKFVDLRYSFLYVSKT